MKASTTNEPSPKERTFKDLPPSVISYERGTIWKISGTRVALERLNSPREALVRNLVNGSIERVAVEDLLPDDIQEPSKSQGIRKLSELPDEIWQRALRQEEEVKSLLDRADFSRDTLEAAANRLGISIRTLRRKLDSYTQQRSLVALLPKPPGPSKGDSGLAPEIEVLLNQEIREFLQTTPDGAVDDLVPVIAAACVAMQFPVPSRATVARRLKRIRSDVENLPGPIRAELKYKKKPVVGRHEAEGPLSIVEMDHTVADVHIIEPTSGQSIGRPVLTMAICRHTKVVLGLTLSLEAPSRLSVGLCLHHSVMPKTPWLQGLGLDDACWPGFGLMRQLYTDNAQEFRAMSLRRSCELYGIDMRFRPPGKPAAGGIIERAIGTFMTKVRLLPGASYSKLLGKMPRGVDRRATITMTDLTIYLAREVSRYHKSTHSGLGEPPLSAWERTWSVNGVYRQPRLPGNGTDFLKCFLMGAWRTITREGVDLFSLRYQCADLWPFICTGRKYLVRYDPRDMSTVYVEIDGGYIAAPLVSHQGLSFSLWEWKEIRAQQIERGRPRSPEQIAKEVLANRELIERKSRKGKAKDVRRFARQAEWAPPPTPAPYSHELMPSPLTCRVEGDE